MKILKERERVEEVFYELVFAQVDAPDCQYRFPCDEKGNVDTEELPEAAQENYLKCVLNNHEVDYVNEGVIRMRATHTKHRVGECEVCGKEVVLSSFTNTCSCGADYNMSGSKLADRSQWGQETGEHWTDCY